MKIKEKKRELLFSVTKKDLKITFFSGKGAGGQHRNKHKNCVRIHHPDSGVMVTGQEERSLVQNKKNAFSRLVNHPHFRDWIRIKASRTTLQLREERKEIERLIDEAMKEENLKVEYFDSDEKKKEIKK